MGEGVGAYFFARNYTKAFVDAYKKESERLLDFCKANLDELGIDVETAIKLVGNVNEQCINGLIEELKVFQYDDADIIEQIGIEFDMTEEEAAKYVNNFNYLQMLDKSIKEAEEGGFVMEDGKMLDIEKYREMFVEFKKLNLSVVLQLISEAESNEEKGFYAAVGSYFLKKKQMETIEKNIF